MNAITNGLSSARNRAGLSKDDVALRLRVTPERVTQWETGEERPCSETLCELSALYQVLPHRLLLEQSDTIEDEKHTPGATSPELADFRRELVAMRDVELLPLDDETIEYCVAALHSRLVGEKSHNK
ncbi:XRE family transcriptional regulator [Hwanghaeella grinnelliae]|uniref:XRE family transcriptional regulator n=1 Tax=Hwanghaeella grinnelliae TaxID=2500179 RepID=A0A3S2VKH9_9PROT|nr:helix-turn-helix transcriptional regulator [Hwanghaeella grinnelliae]RVU34012.1 XRE family transcriptional regulator [Hwanghaeella grinnelliae]